MNLAQASEYCSSLADTLRSLETLERINAVNPNASLSAVIMAGNPDLTQEGDRMLRIVGPTEAVQYYRRRINGNLSDASKLERAFNASTKEHATPRGVSSRPRERKLQSVDLPRLGQPNRLDRPSSLFDNSGYYPWPVRDAGEATLEGFVRGMIADIEEGLRRAQEEEDAEDE